MKKKIKIFLLILIYLIFNFISLNSCKSNNNQKNNNSSSEENKINDNDNNDDKKIDDNNKDNNNNDDKKIDDNNKDNNNNNNDDDDKKIDDNNKNDEHNKKEIVDFISNELEKKYLKNYKINNLKTFSINSKELKEKIFNFIEKNIINKNEKDFFSNFVIKNLFINIENKNNEFYDKDNIEIKIFYKENNKIIYENKLNFLIHDQNNDNFLFFISKIKDKQNIINNNKFPKNNDDLILIFWDLLKLENKNNITEIDNFQKIYNINFNNTDQNNNYEINYFYIINKNSKKEISDLNNNNKFDFLLLLINNIKYEFNNFDNYLKNNKDNLVSSFLDVKLNELFSFENYFNNFKNKNKIENIKKLLHDIDIRFIVNNFFVPNVNYAKLMPRFMPYLLNNTIDSSKDNNKDLWNYFNVLKNDLKNNFNIVIDEGDLIIENIKLPPVNIFILGNYIPNLETNIFDLIKNISPDLIHFHNYLWINNNNNEDKKNYFLYFLKYLILSIENYQVDKENNDNFKSVNFGEEINSNFDSLVYNLFDSFKINNVSSGIEHPISITVESKVLGIWTVSYKDIISAGNPKEKILVNLFKQLFNSDQNNEGYDISKEIKLSIELDLEIILKYSAAVYMPLLIKFDNFIKNRIYYLIKEINIFKLEDIEIINNITGKIRTQIFMPPNIDDWIFVKEYSDSLLEQALDIRLLISNLSFNIFSKLDNKTIRNFIIEKFYINF